MLHRCRTAARELEPAATRELEPAATQELEPAATRELEPAAAQELAMRATVVWPAQVAHARRRTLKTRDVKSAGPRHAHVEPTPTGAIGVRAAVRGSVRHRRPTPRVAPFAGPNSAPVIRTVPGETGARAAARGSVKYRIPIRRIVPFVEPNRAPVARTASGETGARAMGRASAVRTTPPTACVRAMVATRIAAVCRYAVAIATWAVATTNRGRHATGIRAATGSVVGRTHGSSACPHVFGRTARIAVAAAGVRMQARSASSSTSSRLAMS